MNPDLAEAGERLRRSLDDAGPEAWSRLESALTQEGLRRHDAFLDGIEAYRRHPYHRAMPPCPEIWRQGSTRLLDYRRPDGARDAPPVLVIPSLVNRAYILDLLPRRSLMRSLADKGLAPFLVDWDAPGKEETGFTLTDYIAGRLAAALDRVTKECGRPALLLGYCMGGLLALALANLKPAQVAGVVFLATPFDFTAGRAGSAALMAALDQPMGAMIEAAGVAPVDMLQSMFAGLDPGLAVRKFSAFSRLAPKSAAARDFVALEDWANDGVDLAGPVARECLLGWYGANTPMKGEWRVAGNPVQPEALRAPALVMVPARDRIVPPESALALAGRLPNARVMTMKGGHVGMLVSPRARTDVHTPLARWLLRAARSSQAG